MTMLIATHEMGFAREVADEVCFLHEGVIVERGAPGDVLEAPAAAGDAALPAPAARGRAALNVGLLTVSEGAPHDHPPDQ